MNAVEYIVGFGLSGDFGRFRSEPALACVRGQRVVVRSARGVEIGQVLCQGTEQHALFLPNTSLGKLLRLATAADEQTQLDLHGRGQTVLQRAAILSRELRLPLEWLDVEMLLDGKHVVLHYLGAGPVDVRPLVSTLSREFTLHVLLQELSGRADSTEEDDEEHGCGREGCGKGNCSSGGCSTCAVPAPVAQPHFAALREQMEARRTPLL